MAHIITEITNFDNKRNKVTLDYGEVTFLLYKGECRRLGIKPKMSQYKPADTDNIDLEYTGTGDRDLEYTDTDGRDLEYTDGRDLEYTDVNQTAELSDAVYRSIIEDILLPRAKKRVLYYLKSADKTREQIRRKLKEGYYPDAVIEETFKFIDKYGFADDDRYAENYVEELRGAKSKREISLKLKERGISRDKAEAIINSLSDEDEYTACGKALRKKYTRGVSRADRQKAYAYLARRGFSYDAIDEALRSFTETDELDADAFS